MEQKKKDQTKTEVKLVAPPNVPEHLTPEWGRKVQRECARRDPSDLGKRAPCRCD